MMKLLKKKNQRSRAEKPLNHLKMNFAKPKIIKPQESEAESLIQNLMEQ